MPAIFVPRARPRPVKPLRDGAKFREIAIDKAGIEIALAKSRGATKRGQKAGIAARTDHDGLVERIGQTIKRLFARLPVGDQFGDHRIVERRHLAAGLDAAVDAHAVAFGNCSAISRPVDGRKPRSGSSA